MKKTRQIKIMESCREAGAPLKPSAYGPSHCEADVSCRAGLQERFASILSQIMAAISAPPSLAIARMPVGEVTLISVR